MKDCVFCKIVAGEIPSKKVFENEDILAFYDINPSAPIHVLIIPKKHINSLSVAKKVDIKILGDIQFVASEIARKLKISEAFKVVSNSGKGAGQEVFHLHYHLVGGWKGRHSEVINLHD